MTDTELHEDYSRKPWRKVSLADVQTYKPGHVCCAPAWWALTDDDCLLYYKTAPQCNTDERIIKHLYPTLRTVFLEQAFIPRRD